MNVAVAIGSLLVLAAILYTRHPSPGKPQLWAEDASVFYKDSIEVGAASIVKPYAGYHHAAPRLTAYLLHRLPAKYIPQAYMYGGIAWVVVLGAFVYHPRLRLPFKPLLVVLLGLTPNSGETMFNLVNIQWHLCIGLMLYLLIDESRTRLGWILDLVGLTLLSLTGIFSVVAAPFYLIRAAVRRRKYEAVAFLIVAACAAVQVYTMKSTPDAVRTYDWSTVVQFPWIQILLTRCGYSIYFGPAQGPVSFAVLGWCALLVLATPVLFCFQNLSDRRICATFAACWA
ncbi:MAG: hypothetical protein ACRC1K_12795, partial [Planctomycetia bacterium]